MTTRQSDALRACRALAKAIENTRPGDAFIIRALVREVARLRKGVRTGNPRTAWKWERRDNRIMLYTNKGQEMAWLEPADFGPGWQGHSKHDFMECRAPMDFFQFRADRHFRLIGLLDDDSIIDDTVLRVNGWHWAKDGWLAQSEVYLRDGSGFNVATLKPGKEGMYSCYLHQWMSEERMIEHPFEVWADRIEARLEEEGRLKGMPVDRESWRKPKERSK